MQGIFHPLHFAKVLIQTGYEPVPLRRGKLYYFCGADGYCLPNGLSYCRHIAGKHGVATLYRGLPASLSHGITAAFGSTLALIFIDRKHPELKAKGRTDDPDLHKALQVMGRAALREALGKTAGVILASPFRVILIRRIASFVGDELEYNSILGSLRHVYQNEGLSGFFKGVVPLLIAEWGTIWLLHSLSLAVDQTLLRAFNAPLPPPNADADDDDDEPKDASDAASRISSIAANVDGPEGLRKLLKFGLPFIVNNVTYHYNLISTIMTVNNCGLAVGALPYAPAFESWQDCYEHLVSIRELKRGAKLFFRHYLGPITFRNGDTYASI